MPASALRSQLFDRYSTSAHAAGGGESSEPDRRSVVSSCLSFTLKIASQFNPRQRILARRAPPQHNLEVATFSSRGFFSPSEPSSEMDVKWLSVGKLFRVLVFGWLSVDLVGHGIDHFNRYRYIEFKRDCESSGGRLSPAAGWKIPQLPHDAHWVCLSAASPSRKSLPAPKVGSGRFLPGDGV